MGIFNINPPRLLKPREVAEFLCVTTQTLRAYRDKDTGPPYIRLLPKTIRYPSNELEAWVEETGQHRPPRNDARATA